MAAGRPDVATDVSDTCMMNEQQPERLLVRVWHAAKPQNTVQASRLNLKAEAFPPSPRATHTSVPPTTTTPQAKMPGQLVAGAAGSDRPALPKHSCHPAAEAHRS